MNRMCSKYLISRTRSFSESEMRSNWQASNPNGSISSTRQHLVCVWVNSPWWLDLPDQERQHSWVSFHLTSSCRESQHSGALSRLRMRYLLKPWSDNTTLEIQSMLQMKCSRDLNNSRCTLWISTDQLQLSKYLKLLKDQSTLRTSVLCVLITCSLCFQTRPLDIKSSTFKTEWRLC